jgi:hypothetical protein
LIGALAAMAEVRWVPGWVRNAGGERSRARLWPPFAVHGSPAVFL